MLTVAIPVYNMERYLEKSLDAMVNQTCREYEILLIDDGSTDKSKDICLQYQLQYPSLIRYLRKENGGLSSARNYGINHARGKYIVFPDPDDWVEPNYIEVLHGGMSDTVDLFIGGHFIDYPNGRTINNATNFFCGEANSDFAVKHLILSPRITGFAWDKAYRLDIIRENGLKFSDDVGMTEDLDFTYRYLEKCSQAIVSRPDKLIIHYYQSENSATRCRFNDRKVDGLNTYFNIMSVFDNDVFKTACQVEIYKQSNQMCYEIYLTGKRNKNSFERLRRYMKESLSSVAFKGTMTIRDRFKLVLCYYFPKVMYDIKRKLG